MSKWVLLILGIALCVFDAFLPQTTLLSWVGFACVFVALGIIWEEKND